LRPALLERGGACDASAGLGESLAVDNGLHARPYGECVRGRSDDLSMISTIGEKSTAPVLGMIGGWASTVRDRVHRAPDGGDETAMFTTLNEMSRLITN
jgi:hypothetical protein